MKKNNEITNEQADNLINFIEEIYASPHSLSQRNFHDQLTVTNYYFFKKLFSNYSKSVPNLIFLSQEMVVMKLIKNHHLYNSTLINQMLFDPSTIELIKKYYEGLNGAFSFKNKTGTFLFWGLPKKSKNRMQLWHKNNCLVSNDESFKVELTPDAINESLIKRELIPNTHLNYTMLAFYYGQYLAGGPAQTKNIASMRDAFTKMVTEAGNTEALEALEGLQTKNLVLSRPTLAYIDNPKQDQRIPATGLDMILYGDKGTSWDSIISATKNTTLSEFFDRGLVSFYQEFVPNDRKTDEMSKITERDIEVLTGLDKKIPALINV